MKRIVSLLICFLLVAFFFSCAVQPNLEEKKNSAQATSSEQTIHWKEGQSKGHTFTNHDLDGNGINEKVVVEANLIYIYKDGQGYGFRYSISSWKAVTFRHFDDQPGKEIGVIQHNNNYSVISFKQRIQRDYYVGYWKAISYREVDGHYGDEIIVHNTNHNMKIVCFRTNEARTYFVGQWKICQYQELDGIAGLEIIFDHGIKFRVVDFAANHSQVFPHPAYSSYTYYNQDGQPGDELVASVANNRKWVLCWRRRTYYYF